MNRSRLLFVLFALLLVSSAAKADITADLQSVVDRFHAENPHAPGIVVHVECPRLGVDRTFVTGTEARGSDVPLTAAHTFRIASNTKTYVATAILRLAELGRLDLDDSFGDHLPAGYRDLLQGDGYDLDAITLRMVLGHTAGLFEHPSDPRYAEMILADPQHAWTADEQIGYTVEWGDPVGAPGEKFVYSDSGYILLGEIIQEKTGKNLGESVHELCDYEKLGMDSTWWEIFEEAPVGAGPRAHQYFEDIDTVDWHPGLDLHGGGGLLTDAHDLERFMRLLVKGEVLAEESTLAAMIGGGTTEYRLGVFCIELGGRVAIGHTGFWNTFAFHVPSLDVTVGGAVLSRETARGQVLAEELVKTVAAAGD